MSTITGTVSEISSKPWNKVLLHSFKIEGQDRWYRLGRTPPPFEKGNKIKFVERNSNVIPESITPECSAAPQSTVTKESASAEPARSAVDVGRRMQYQAARRDAANIVVAALHTDALPWASNVAKNKKLDLLTGYIQQVTKTLLEQEEENAG